MWIGAVQLARNLADLEYSSMNKIAIFVSNTTESIEMHSAELRELKVSANSFYRCAGLQTSGLHFVSFIFGDILILT